MRRLVALAAVALGLAGCGGGGEGGSEAGGDVVSAKAWIGAFCAAGVDWHGDLEENAAALETRVADAQRLEEVRRELARYFDRAAALTDETVTEIEGAGTPEIDDREQVVADFTGLIADMGGLFTKAGDEVRGLETGNEAQFRTRVTEIAERLQTRANAVVGDFTALTERYESPELDEAFAENEDCAQFSGDAS